VRRVDIPKADGGTRALGIPTVADRVAQEVARRYLEPRLEPVFHADSYGYRPGKSAIDAVRQARARCWRYDWVLDLDVKAYFDSIDWELMLRAVRRHTNQPWVLLYIERWLKAPVQLEDGSVVPRMSGTPQGGVVSPILANLFLHYAFDMWMARTFPHIPFERYADDAICHCKSAEEAQAFVSACRYPPAGIRGYGPRRAGVYGFDVDEYMQIANECMICIPIIESRRAVENIESIVAVDGIDGVSVGPMDLSIDMGMFRQFDHPDYLDAVEKVRQACKKHRKAMGTGCYSLEHAKQCRDLGDSLLLAAGDDGYLASEAGRCIRELRHA